jgi:2-polyprenyl-3-methyl-5-hydroxy-6-metoxy-1,4-benzoquinol methylase
VKRHPLGYIEAVEKPTEAALRTYYAERYFQCEAGNYRANYTLDEFRYFETKLVQKRRRIESIRGLKPGRMLDVGCGEGFALAHFRRANWQVEGLDYSTVGVAAMNPDCLDALRTGDVTQLLAEKCRVGEIYDVVWLNNVLEHLADPPEMMCSLRNLVGPNGLAVITVPNDFSALQHQLIDTHTVDQPYWVTLPDHLAYFDRETLIALSTATGWRCHDVLAEFPIDWFILHPGSNYVKDCAAGGGAHRARIAIENLIGEEPVELVNAFYSAMAGVGLGRNITAFLTPEDI